MRAFDENGIEVFPCQIKSIAPIEHAEEAREISFEFMQSLGGEDTVEQMLPVLLRPIGGIPTHVYCSRDSYTHELQKQLNFLAQREDSWISGNLETSPSEIFVKFCTFNATLEELGLEVC